MMQLLEGLHRCVVPDAYPKKLPVKHGTTLAMLNRNAPGPLLGMN